VLSGEIIGNLIHGFRGRQQHRTRLSAPKFETLSTTTKGLAEHAAQEGKPPVTLRRQGHYCSCKFDEEKGKKTADI